MAGRETPRQKMINMMYLIFIAMLALNMSKEVLTALPVTKHLSPLFLWHSAAPFLSGPTPGEL